MYRSETIFCNGLWLFWCLHKCVHLSKYIEYFQLNWISSIKIDELYCTLTVLQKSWKTYRVLKSFKEQEINITEGKWQLINLG